MTKGNSRTHCTAVRPLSSSDSGAATQRLADELERRDGTVRQRAAAVLRELGAVDQAVYSVVAATPTPSLDGPLRRLSDAANNSVLWLAIAAGLGVAGGTGGGPGAGRTGRAPGRGARNRGHRRHVAAGEPGG